MESEEEDMGTATKPTKDNTWAAYPSKIIDLKAKVYPRERGTYTTSRFFSALRGNPRGKSYAGRVWMMFVSSRNQSAYTAKYTPRESQSLKGNVQKKSQERGLMVGLALGICLSTDF